MSKDEIPDIDLKETVQQGKQEVMDKKLEDISDIRDEALYPTTEAPSISPALLTSILQKPSEDPMASPLPDAA